jgi:hypothetical protein
LGEIGLDSDCQQNFCSLTVSVFLYGKIFPGEENCSEGESTMEIIDFSSEKNKHSIKKGVLRRLPDCYEYCFLPDYEMKYDSFQSQSIQMLEFFFTLLELKNKTLFVSVQFPLYYDTDRIQEFLGYYTFSYDEKDEKGYYVKNAQEIVEGKLFKGKPLVIGRRGRKKLYYDVSDFIEVTAHYNQYHQIVHTGHR